MNWKSIHRITSGIVFLYALALYLLTIAPTASFWDAGEFIAIANRLQVSHPPGAPLYMLIGRLFSMFVPVEYVAVSINLISVLASAFTILLTHVIIVRLVREWRGHPAEWTSLEHFMALAGGVIGAITFAVTDSFWFNAVEAEVYALSMLFTALVVWLIMRWSEQAKQEESLLRGGQHPFGLSANRYLILIAYLFGLAIGVHLLNLLAIFYIALIFFFNEIERPEWDTRKRWTYIFFTGAVSACVFLAIYPGIVQGLPELAGNSGAPVFFLLVFLFLLVFGIRYTQRNSMQVTNLALLSLTVVLIGYSSYTLIFVRSAADPPIDENDPETTEAIVSYLKREQYGSTPLFRGNTFDSRLGRIDFDKEVYFPRRYSPDPTHLRIYARYDSDMEFFWKYQIGHMYVRYFLWNFVGKASDEQDAPPYSGISFLDASTTADTYFMQTPSEEAGRNGYFALPLLLGLMGAGFHFSRDWRRAFSLLVLFAVSGLGIILYLNQTPIQPRERDYSYVASFFAFSIWIGIGATGILQLTLDILRQRFNSTLLLRTAVLGLGALLAFAVPIWMTIENYDDHTRAGRYVAPDYAHNMLATLEENAIIFTNGDNDTFPLWYLQEVERVRTDVRVVNLSLLNTPWYVRQLKNQWSRESAPLPISLTEQQIDDLTISAWEPKEVSIPVNTRRLLQESEMYIPLDDTSEIESPMTWRLEGRPYNDEISILYAADWVALDILRTNAQQNWSRPVYFAVTVSPDGQLDLQEYFQIEGQAFRVVPIKHDKPLGRVVPGLTSEKLKAFRFTGIDDPDVYYDENIRRMVDNYRNIYGHTAQELAELGYYDEAVALLDTLMQNVPFETIPGDERSFLLLGRAYQETGNIDRVVELMKLAEPLVLFRLERARTSRDLELAAQYVQMIRYTYIESGDFIAASDFSSRLAEVLQDSTYRQSPEEIEEIYIESVSDSSEAAPVE